MNQPKFKFGDRAEYVSPCRTMGTVFHINKIEFHVNNSDGSGEYKYNGAYWESEISLYQEPQKKKLYAWASHDGVIFHVKNKDAGKEVFHRIGIDAQSFTRSPEDDIEYPEQNGLMQIKKDQG